MDSYQSLLGISDASVDILNVDTLIVKKDLTIFGDSTILHPIFPTGAALNKVLTCQSLLGDAIWALPADATLAGDCTGFGSNNRVDTLAGGTLPVNTLATLTGTQTLTNKTLGDFTVSGVETLQKNMWFNNQLNTKMIDLWDSGTPSNQTQHNFYGFGVSLGELRYHVAGTTAAHVFYTSTSATTSTELFRIGGNGVVTLPGTLKLSNGAGTGKVLTSDASGNAFWLAPSLVTSVNDLTVNGNLLTSAGDYLLSGNTDTIWIGRAGHTIFSQHNLGIGYKACSTINPSTGFCATNHVAIGNYSLMNSTGNNNCAVGINSSLANTTGSANSAYGVNAMVANTGGNYCVSVGFNSGSHMNGDSNTCVGANSDVTSGIVNATALGYQASCATSNTVQLGNSSVTAVNTSGAIYTPSVVSTICTAVNYNAPGYRAPTTQGTYMTWNREGGTGRACWGNQKGYGYGGHEWVDFNLGTAVTTVLASLDNSGSFTANSLNSGTATISTLTSGNLNSGATNLGSLVVGGTTTLAGLGAGATTVTSLNSGAVTAGATTLASLNVSGNSLLQQLGVLSTISCQYGISCGSLSFPLGGASSLSYFEEFTMPVKWSGPFPTLIDDTFKISRIGSLVTVQYNGFSETATMISNVVQTHASTLIPLRFIKSVSNIGMCLGGNGGVATTFSLSTNASGYMFIYLIPAGGNFSLGTWALEPGTFSWIL